MDRIVRRFPQPDPYSFCGGSRVLSVAFTGYRPQKMPFGYDERDPRCLDFKARLESFIEMLMMEGYTHFIVGGALGTDMYAAEAVLRLRRRYPRVTLEVAVPFDAQATRWPAASQARYYAMLEAADVLTYVNHAYTPDCMLARNHYMVTHSDLLVAVYDGQNGGTAATISMARQLQKPISVIPPVVGQNAMRRTA